MRRFYRTALTAASRAWHRAICIGLILSLLTVSTPAAPQTIVATAQEWRLSFGFWFRSSSLPKLIQGGNRNRTQETQTQREEKIARVEIFPKNANVELESRIRFSAVAYDLDGNTIGGIKFKWRADNATTGKRAPIAGDGEFRAKSSGSFTISAEAKGQNGEVTVVVQPGVPHDPNLQPIRTRTVSTRDDPSPQANARGKTRTQEAAVVEKRATGRKASQRSHASKMKAAAPEPPMLPGEGWDDSNYWSADDPGNRVGDTPGTPLDGGAGSGNFQFNAPIYNAPGRGINISLGAAYNSRVWNLAGSQISYDIDRGWPAPGWSLGLGKLLAMGVYNGTMIVDGDGTRHSFTGSITIFNWGTIGVLHTTDGSLIDYKYQSGTGGAPTWAEARYPNGTYVQYGAMSGDLHPTFIQDANGNFVNITYVNNVGPRIQTIQDTLGRTITFHYDPSNRLTAITGPGFDNGPARTLARFHYKQISLGMSGAFNGLTPVARDPNPWVIDAIYYPGTGTGYWFGDSDSYSTYGMLAKVVEQRGMGFSASSLNDQGTVTQGTITRRDTYNYPLTPNSSLTDAPTYTSLTQEWSRDGTNFDSATTGYEVFQNANPRTITVTWPNGTKNKQYSYNYSSLPDTNPLKALDGVTYRDETYVTPSTILQSSTSTWEKGAYDTPRPLRVEKTNERNQTIAAEFSYTGGVYNQVTELRDYDYGGALRRATRTTYENNAIYTGSCNSSGCFGRHIYNLPLTVDVFTGDNVTRVSRTVYQYDGQPLTAAPNVVMHNQASNPHADAEGFCFWQPDPFDPDCYSGCPPELMGCDGFCPEVYNCPYDSSTDYRGNVTQVTTYANASNLTGAIAETRRYDVTGNMVKESAACCEETNIGYTINTQYAYPESNTRGSATDGLAQVTTSTIYDFNTGLPTSTKDANNRQTQADIDPATLRVTRATLPTGAHTHYAYDDNLMQVTATTYSEPHVANETAIAGQNIKLLNGNGQVWQEKARGPDNGQQQTWDAIDTIYNNMRQIAQQSRPYRVGSGTPVFTVMTYDALGRTTIITEPDGSVTQIFYNEATRPDVASSSSGETARLRDAWGRERWARADENGRLVEIVEPNPNGNGTVATGGLVTTYAYNTLGDLVQTNQGGQIRSFKFDSLGRLTAQKLAETSATLNDAGVYVGAGTWSEVLTYDERSNVISRTDARGVKTVFSYNNDPLSRLQSMSWDTSGFGDTGNPIVAAATVSYQYRQKSTGTEIKDITQVETVSTAGVSTESYGFDAEGRVSSKTLTLTSRPGFPFVTNYTFDKLNRLTDVLYPAQYGNGAAPRKAVHHDYDIASRLSGLTYDGQSFASNIAYGPASQATSLNVGTGGNQILESYAYSSQTGLLDSQTVSRGATTLLNLSYDYADASGKRTGQLRKILNNLNPNKDRSYSYDTLGRLTQATGGPAATPLWTQTYAYDRYGNRLSVRASGYQAKNQNNSRSGEQLLAANKLSIPTPPDYLRASEDARTANMPLSDSSLPLFPPAPQSGPPTFTNDPLQPGVTTIQALHITELRTAINSLRNQRGLGNYAWQYSVTTNDLISANPIIEMRTALDQALGAPSGGYSAGLAQGQPVLAVHIQELRDRVKNNWNSSISISRDGHASLSYDTASNRITTAGFAYDAAGNQVRALIPGGTGSQRYRYDAANRLAQVRTDDNNTIIASHTYGCDNQRLITEESGIRTYYVADGLAVAAEYTESGTTPAWSKSYVYLDKRLLSTTTPNGAGGEAIQFHHPDQLGTRLVTNPATGTFFEQQTLPFGTALNETPPPGATTGSTNRRFTSYDRSSITGLDYAVNRHYDAQQGRFTQVDPASMRAVNLENPQTLNLYAYCSNDPINRTDPDGLGFFSFLKKLFKWIVVALTVVVAVLTVVYTGQIHAAIGLLKTVLALVGAVANAIGAVLNAVGVKAGLIFELIGLAATFGMSLANIAGKGWALAKTIFKAIQDGAALASKTLTAFGKKKLGQIFDLVSSVAGFISGSIRQKDGGPMGFHPKKWAIYKFVRSTVEKVATIAGHDRFAAYVNVVGLVDDIGDIYYLIQDPFSAGGVLSNNVNTLSATLSSLIVESTLAVYKKINSAFGRIDKAISLARPANANAPG